MVLIGQLSKEMQETRNKDIIIYIFKNNHTRKSSHVHTNTDIYNRRSIREVLRKIEFYILLLKN